MDSSDTGGCTSAKAFLDAHFKDEESLVRAAPTLQELRTKHAELIVQRSAAEEAARAGVARTREVAEAAKQELVRLQQKRAELSATLGQQHRAAAGQLRPELAQLLRQINQLQEVQSYVQLLIHVHHLRDQIYQTAESATKSAVEHLLQLLSLKATVSARSCGHLSGHIAHTFDQCLAAVVSQLKSRVRASFEAIQWPKLPATSQPLNPPAPDSSALDAFHKAFSLLLLVQLTVEGVGNESGPSVHVASGEGAGDVGGGGGDEEASVVGSDDDDDLRGVRLDEVRLGNREAGAYLWGIQLLLEPLVKRFRFHFMGKRPTNNLEKPEWFLMDTREVIRLNSQFLLQEVQPLIDKKRLTYYNAKTELMKGLIEVIKEKTRRGIDAICSDEALFVHHLNETLDFHKALVDLYDYPSERWIEGRLNPPTVLDPYTDRLDRWIALENRLATEHLKATLETSAHPWALYYGLGGAVALAGSATVAVTATQDPKQQQQLLLHEMKPTRSANALVTTLASVTERYRMLPRMSHRLRFMHDIQITLLALYMAKAKEAYEDHLAELARHQFGPACGVVNSLKYCASVLKDWGEQLFFLQLRQAELALGDADDYSIVDAPFDPTSSSNAAEDDTVSTVFDEVVMHYKRLRKEITQHVIGVILRTFKTLTHAHLAVRRIWRAELEADEAVEASILPRLDLSPGICDGLLRLRRDMAELHAHLCAPVFGQVWEQVATELNEFVFLQLLSRRHHFHRVGALQFQHDMRALFLIFGDFTPAPHSFFKDVKEAATVLTLSADGRERARGLLAPLLATAAADTRVSLLAARETVATGAPGRGHGDDGDDDDDDAEDDGRGGSVMTAAGQDERAEAFARLGLFKLTPRHIDLLLSLRIDLP